MEELVALLTRHGLAVVFGVTLAARIGAPVPAAPLLVVAGALARMDQLSAWACIAVSLAANLAGDAVWFWSGRRWGHRVLRVLCRISMSPDSCVSQSESLILKWGGHSLVAAKFVPGVSVVAAPMAGALAMPWSRFLLFGLFAGAVWTLAFLGLGMLFSAQVGQVLALLAEGGVIAGAAVVLVVVALLARRWWRRRRFRREVAIPRITVQELRSLMQDGRAPVVIDVRARGSTQADPRRIPGARAVELNAIEALAPELPQDREIVLYCNCPNEASAARAAVLLAGKGVQRARPLAGGLEAWWAAEPALSLA
ncbi:sulfurtransferase [Ramlibacter sp. G-1-2-2]|uniref:Sulfurtransferase n=1 Tax=Ramlibacter agri TaxID=2728837 RepID=A0A848HAZ7_9BURK|nr:DedA family protein/thiosulfate sulfurtransferase GlpE [Ramlibacter agri]NML47654.1 sulfurtransferase [Ramlibacter agri]